MSTETSGKSRGRGPILPLAAIAVVSIFLFVHAGSIPAPGRLPGQLGPDLWPRFILTILVVLCLVKIIQLISARKEEVGNSEVTDQQEEPREKRVFVLALVAVFAFVLAIHFLGFFLATLFFLWVFTFLGRWRKKGFLVLLAIVGDIVINYLFLKIIYVPLPKGQYVFESITVAIYRMLGIF